MCIQMSDWVILLDNNQNTLHLDDLNLQLMALGCFDLSQKFLEERAEVVELDNLL